MFYNSIGKWSTNTVLRDSWYMKSKEVFLKKSVKLSLYDSEGIPR